MLLFFGRGEGNNFHYKASNENLKNNLKLFSFSQNIVGREMPPALPGLQGPMDLGLSMQSLTPKRQKFCMKPFRSISARLADVSACSPCRSQDLACQLLQWLSLHSPFCSPQVPRLRCCNPNHRCSLLLSKII